MTLVNNEVAVILGAAGVKFEWPRVLAVMQSAGFVVLSVRQSVQHRDYVEIQLRSELGGVFGAGTTIGAAIIQAARKLAEFGRPFGPATPCPGGVPWCIPGMAPEEIRDAPMIAHSACGASCDQPSDHCSGQVFRVRRQHLCKVHRLARGYDV